MKFKEGDIIVNLHDGFTARVLRNLENDLIEVSYSLATFGSSVDATVVESDYELDSIVNSPLKEALVEDEV